MNFNDSGLIITGEMTVGEIEELNRIARLTCEGDG
jgi:hypothetical protein